MTGRRIPMVIVCIILAAVPLRGQDVWFSDDFSSGGEGARWHAVRGAWSFTPGSVRLSTTAYDQLLASTCYLYDTRPWSAEVSLRGPRVGIFFGLEDTSSKALAHMVRFDEGSILSGHFDAAGEFVATGSFASPDAGKAWTILRVDCDPARKRYSVFVNGTVVGVDTVLKFPSGYFGLQGSDGTSEFRSVRIFGASSAPSPPRWQRGAVARFNHLRFVRAGQNNVTIYDPESHSYLALDLKGKILSQQPARPPAVAALEARRPGLEVSVAPEGITITGTHDGTSRTLPVRVTLPSAVLVDADTTVYVADAARRVIVAVSPDGQIVREMDGSSIGGFIAPRGLDFYGRHQIVVADYDRIVFIDKDLREPASLTPIGPTTVRAAWRAEGSDRPFLRYAADGGQWSTATAHATSGGNEVEVLLSGLRPATRYSFMMSHALRVLPEQTSLSKEYRIATKPADAGTMLYTRLPILCLVYRSITYRDRYPANRYPLVPEGRRLTDDDIALLRRACQFNSEFYFRNSGCRLLLDFDFFVVDEPLKLADLGDRDPYWLSPTGRVEADVERAARSLNKSPGQYAGVVVPYAWQNYPPRRTSALADPSKNDTISIRQAYGGGTLGVPAPWKYGKNSGYTSNPFQDRFSRQDWLMTHEFHHQLDALLDVSGHPEYYHADQPWKMPGRFGEDFDFNAQIIRNAAADWWLTLKFGSLEQTADADHDSVPDDDPRLPLDEKRLGGSSGSGDTDHDGLRDLAEVMAGSSRGTSLNNPDTDGDGLNDGVDPEPLYPFAPEIARLANTTELLSHPFATMTTTSVATQWSWGWTDSALYVGCDSPVPVNLLIQIDAKCDGWFHGLDNFQIRVRRDTATASVIEYYLRDCSSWTDPPRDRKDLLKPADLITIATRTGDSTLVRYQTVVRIPRCDAYGLELKKGKTIALRLGCQSVDDRWVWDELLERNAMMKVSLK